MVFGLRKDPYITVQNPHKFGQHLIKTPWVISDSVSTWNWSGCEGNPAIVEIYSPGEEVELFVNGVSQGKKAAGKNAGFRTLFEVVYEPGTVEAVAYENGQEIGRMELQSAESEVHLELEIEGGRAKELSYIHVWLKDSQGRVMTDCDKKLTAEVTGDADLAGFGSGNPKPEHNYNEGITETFHGHALLILRKSEGTESCQVKIKSEDGLSVEASF